MTARITELSDFRKPILSPLRYPGGKASLYRHLRSIIEANALTAGTYVEPYAGGAGAALALLATGRVRRIVINDLDPAVYAFWMAAVNEPDRFATLISRAKLDVTEWSKQKDIYLNAPRDDFLRLGFATFYLNRTNRSGVLNGGPIGGMDQTGNYKIDARFNKPALVKRIETVGLHAKNISVMNTDGMSVIKKYSRQRNVFIYADPPYFEKAGSLYMNSFTPQHHEALAQLLNDLAECRWVLTYDNVPKVQEIYAGRRSELVTLYYSAHRVVRAKEIMIYSDALVIPEAEPASATLFD